MVGWFWRLTRVATDSRWVVPLRSVLTGLAVFVLGSVFDVLIHPYSSLSISMMDDALVGVGAGLLVFFYEHRQRHDIIRKLEVIRQMNHHVRNSLQVITTAASISERQELAKAIHAAVERIEWALQEVLPGQREDIGELSFHPPASEPIGEEPKDKLAS